MDSRIFSINLRAQLRMRAPRGRGVDDDPHQLAAVPRAPQLGRDEIVEIVFEKAAAPAIRESDRRRATSSNGLVARSIDRTPSYVAATRGSAATSRMVGTSAEEQPRTSRRGVNKTELIDLWRRSAKLCATSSAGQPTTFWLRPQLCRSCSSRRLERSSARIRSTSYRAISINIATPVACPPWR